jgi:hypothetical protein
LDGLYVLDRRVGPSFRVESRSSIQGGTPGSVRDWIVLPDELIRIGGRRPK